MRSITPKKTGPTGSCAGNRMSPDQGIPGWSGGYAGKRACIRQDEHQIREPGKASCEQETSAGHALLKQMTCRKHGSRPEAPYRKPGAGSSPVPATRFRKRTGEIPGEACKAGEAVKRLICEMWNVSVEKAGNPPAGYYAAETETGMPSGTGRGLCPGTPVGNGENRQRESRSIRQTDRRRDEPSGVSVSGKNRSMQRQNGKGRRNPATRDATVIHVPT